MIVTELPELLRNDQVRNSSEPRVKRWVNLGNLSNSVTVAPLWQQ